MKIVSTLLFIAILLYSALSLGYSLGKQAMDEYDARTISYIKQHDCNYLGVTKWRGDNLSVYMCDTGPLLTNMVPTHE